MIQLALYWWWVIKVGAIVLMVMGGIGVCATWGVLLDGESNVVAGVTRSILVTILTVFIFVLGLPLLFVMGDPPKG